MKKDTLESLAAEDAAAFAKCVAIVENAHSECATIVENTRATCDAARAAARADRDANLRDIARRRDALEVEKCRVAYGTLRAALEGKTP